MLADLNVYISSLPKYGCSGCAHTCMKNTSKLHMLSLKHTHKCQLSWFQKRSSSRRLQTAPHKRGNAALNYDAATHTPLLPSLYSVGFCIVPQFDRSSVTKTKRHNLVIAGKLKQLRFSYSVYEAHRNRVWIMPSTAGGGEDGGSREEGGTEGAGGGPGEGG